jgi:hypothetical protein
MTASKFIKAIALAMSISGIVACGGGGGGDDVAGIGGTGITASGTITGFGSIFVNGIRFDVENSEVVVDDDDTRDLKLGMVVKVQGSIDSTGLNGIANSVEYDDVVQGAVLNVSGTGATRNLEILGVTVVVSEQNTVLQGVVFDDISALDIDELDSPLNGVVEISGYFDNLNQLQATRLEYKEPFNVSSEIEAHGKVVNDNTLDVTQFGLDIDGDGAYNRIIETFTNHNLTDGLIVEVKGTMTTFDGNIINATSYEQKDTLLGDFNGEVSVEGIVTNFDSDLKRFNIADVVVDYSSASFEPLSLATTLGNGMKVEVEGAAINGAILIADEIEADDEIKLGASVSAVDTVNKTITVSYANGSIVVETDTNTQYENIAGELSGINDSDYVIVEGFKAASGNVLADEVKREDLDDDLLQGPSEACTAGSEITILGVTFELKDDGTTDYFNFNETPMVNSAEFCDSASNAGVNVKIVDNEPADGIADEAELED